MGDTRNFLQNRIHWVSEYILSRLPMWSERFLRNLGPTGGAPFGPVKYVKEVSYVKHMHADLSA